MAENSNTPKDLKPTQEELEKLDADLLEIELLYQSRCVKAQPGTNVVVREIEPEKK